MNGLVASDNLDFLSGSGRIRYQKFVWRGEELVNIYNDAYAPLLGQRTSMNPWG